MFFNLFFFLRLSVFLYGSVPFMSMSGYSGSSLQGNSSSLIFQIVVHLCQKLRWFDITCYHPQTKFWEDNVFTRACHKDDANLSDLVIMVQLNGDQVLGKCVIVLTPFIGPLALRIACKNPAMMHSKTGETAISQPSI